MTIRRERRQDCHIVDQHRTIVTLLADFRACKIDRRSFLSKISALLAMTSFPLVIGADGTAGDSHKTGPLTEPWITFATVQNHLFPTTADAPGAKEINATAYLRRILAEAHTDPDDKKFIRNGVDWLNDIAKDKHNRTFHELTETQRETVLRQIEKSGPGDRWLSLILLYIFEALLSAPVYGGNPDGVGWTWLGHKPGFPLPPANKTYSSL